MASLASRIRIRPKPKPVLTNIRRKKPQEADTGSEIHQIDNSETSADCDKVIIDSPVASSETTTCIKTIDPAASGETLNNVFKKPVGVAPRSALVRDNKTSVVNSGQINKSILVPTAIVPNKTQFIPLKRNLNYKSLNKKSAFKPALDRQRAPTFVSTTYGKMGAEAKQQMFKRFGDSKPVMSKLTMLDLIFFNPTENPMDNGNSSSTNNDVLPLNPTEKFETHVGKIKGEIVNGDDLDGSVTDDVGENEDQSPVPQIKLDADGKVIIAPESLVIKKNKAKKILIIEEDQFGPKIKNKRTCGDRHAWTHEETVKFYKALHALGSNFEAMLSLFPGRTRKHLKMKFKREEKVNAKLIDKVMGSRYAQYNIERLEEELSANKQYNRVHQRLEKGGSLLKLNTSFKQSNLNNEKPPDALTIRQWKQIRRKNSGVEEVNLQALRKMGRTLIPTTRTNNSRAATDIVIDKEKDESSDKRNVKSKTCGKSKKHDVKSKESDAESKESVSESKELDAKSKEERSNELLEKLTQMLLSENFVVKSSFHTKDKVNYVHSVSFDLNNLETQDVNQTIVHLDSAEKGDGRCNNVARSEQCGSRIKNLDGLTSGVTNDLSGDRIVSTESYQKNPYKSQEELEYQSFSNGNSSNALEAMNNQVIDVGLANIMMIEALTFNADGKTINNNQTNSESVNTTVNLNPYLDNNKKRKFEDVEYDESDMTIKLKKKTANQLFEMCSIKESLSLPNNPEVHSDVTHLTNNLDNADSTSKIHG